jgi:hypothetical protein
MAGIRFLTNEANKVEGLAYAGFETFRGSPYTSCARETGQNSRDAPGGGGTVKVSFDLLHIDRGQVPFAEELEQAVRCCLEAPQNEKTKAHLERALAAITPPQVKVLRISDTNTTGLTGPIDDPTSVFTALVKGDGITNKPDDTSAGSYGIGKNAAFAVSDLQTVIYSTRYEDQDREERFAAQGRLRLISHVNGERKCSAEGYWGEADFRAIEDPDAVPEWMSRDAIGTSIHAIGFDERDHWAQRMTLSLATNFFAAIDRDEIEFTVDGSRINRASLDSVLDDQELEELAEQGDQLSELERARRLLLCIRSEAASHHKISIAGLGDFTLHLLVSEGLPREVHILRNGIYITDNFAKFSQPMRQFPGTRELIAVLEPARTGEGKGPSALLKQLENPAHDAFEPDRIASENDRKTARSQIKKLIGEVRNVIRAEARIEEVENSRLDELSAMFADTGATRDEGREDDEKDPDAYVYQKPRRGRPPRTTGTTGKGRARERGKEKGRKPGARVRSSPDRKKRNPLGAGPAVPLKEVRSIVRDADPRLRTVWFTPSASGKIILAIEASGLIDDVSLDIEACGDAEVKNGRVHTSVKEDERIRLDLTLSEPFDGPVELSAAAFVEQQAEAA